MMLVLAGGLVGLIISAVVAYRTAASDQMNQWYFHATAEERFEEVLKGGFDQMVWGNLQAAKAREAMYNRYITKWLTIAFCIFLPSLGLAFWSAMSILFPIP